MTPFLCAAMMALGAGAEPCDCWLKLLCPCAGVTGCGTAATPYDPQAGDLLLFHSNKLPPVGHATHAAIVAALPDGRGPALLETARYGSPVAFNDIACRVRTYEGRVFVRRRCVPLTADQSARLTAFCSQLGKPHHWGAILTTPFCWPVRLVGGRCLRPKDLDPRHWYCASLVVGAAVAAGLLNPCVVKPCCTVPQDLMYDRALDLSCGWEKPARCVCEGCAQGCP